MADSLGGEWEGVECWPERGARHIASIPIFYISSFPSSSLRVRTHAYRDRQQAGRQLTRGFGTIRLRRGQRREEATAHTNDGDCGQNTNVRDVYKKEGPGCETAAVAAAMWLTEEQAGDLVNQVKRDKPTKATWKRNTMHREEELRSC